MSASEKDREAALWSNVLPTEGCWHWTGRLNRYGYGVFYANGKQPSAHRAMYQSVRGPIPAGLTLDHLCRNRSCVNPEHLEPVTNKVNLLRGFSPMAVFARRTHCVRGHEFSPHNTRIRPEGGRECLECKRIRNRVYDKARSKDATAKKYAGYYARNRSEILRKKREQYAAIRALAKEGER